MLNFASWRLTWRKWSRANRLAAIAALLAIMLGFVQAVQLVSAAFTWAHNWAYGPPPLDLPLPKILEGALDEIDYNLDCLESYDRLRKSEVEYTLCQPKRRFLDSLFHHVSVLTSRDQYSDSTRTWEDWKLVSQYYNELQKVKTSSEFNDLEKRSKISLRDALFLTGYIKYYYKNFYVEIEGDGCVPFGKIELRCRPILEALAKELKRDAEQVERWAGMPAKYALFEGKPVDSYVSWLALND